MFLTSSELYESTASPGTSSIEISSSGMPLKGPTSVSLRHLSCSSKPFNEQ